MIDEMTGPGGWGVLDLVTAAGAGRPVVVSDIGYGDNALFRQQLTAAGWQYVVAVKGSPRAHPAAAVAQAMALRRARPPPKPAATAAAAGQPCASSPSPAPGQVRPVTWRQGTKAARGNPDALMTSHFLAIRVRPGQPAHHPRGRPELPGLLAAGRMAARSRRARRLLAVHLPEDTPTEELVRLAKIRWRIEHDYRELKTGLGLDHFEGRSFAGWHRHVTLAALAQAFCTLLRTDPKALRRDDPLPGPARTADRARPHPRRLPLCCQPLTLGRLAAALAET